MRVQVIDPNYEAWRDAARGLLNEMVQPTNVIWENRIDNNESESLLDFNQPQQKKSHKGKVFKISKQFIQLAKTVSSHRSGRQWGTMYEVLWEIIYGNDRSLLQRSTDSRVRSLEKMRSMVSRDIHKMRAFVRFREVESFSVDGSKIEYYVAWFEPEHRIVRLNASFFRKRFGGMHFSILTPDECMHWNGVEVSFTEGVTKDAAPSEDDLEELWRGYYRSIFNPARLKVKMMQSEMPKKYWKNLPEAEIIEELIRESSEQVSGMMKEENRELKPRPNNKYLDYLDELNEKDVVD